MMRRAVIILLWLSVMILASAVSYGLTQRWGRFEAVVFGIPLLVWFFLTWRKVREATEAEIDFGLTFRIISVCLFSCVLMLGLEREFIRYIEQPWISVIALFWMSPPLLLFFRKLVEVRRTLYQK